VINVTVLYFVRHAEPNYNNNDDITRELTEKGMKDRELVTKFLDGKNIDVVLSSPYKRAIDTVKHFADSQGLHITIIDDFRERKVDNHWIEDFQGFCRKQWEDFDYKLQNGESLKEVQTRNISALQQVLIDYNGKNVVIASHGTALSSIINYFEPSFGYRDLFILIDFYLEYFLLGLEVEVLYFLRSLDCFLAI
jgi:2,3-bisphosphoglycerate-dependent phosphoglycerate mutase